MDDAAILEAWYGLHTELLKPKPGFTDRSFIEDLKREAGIDLNDIPDEAWSYHFNLNGDV